MTTAKPTVGSDGLARCHWVGEIAEFVPYHDDEWGFPIDDDQRLFEKLSLESFQSGLSWRTILNKREAFREVFCDFDYRQVAEFDDRDIQRLLEDVRIVRHRAKIESVINNAQRMQELIDQGGSLATFVWQFEPARDELGPPQSLTTCPSAVALSKELKRRGWKFLGPTTVFAFMQSMGLVNDHQEGCHVRTEVDQARRDFEAPVAPSQPLPGFASSSRPW